MSASAARRAALETLTRVRERAAFAHETLDAVLGQARLDARDTAFATRLAYGAVATRGTLDDAVGRFVRDPSRLEPIVADALALSAYELLFMRTPARAAVSQGVELVRGIRQSAAGLANAVLRRVAEQAAAFPWGDPDTDLEALARLHGHPLWLAQMLEREYGRPAAGAIMAADNEPAPLYLASLKTADEYDALLAALDAAGAQPVACTLERCIEAREPAAARAHLHDQRPAALVMDAAAQFAVHTVRPATGCSIVEIGAGRGSKSLLLATLASDVSVTAVDLHAYKLQALEAAAAALGITGIRTVVADAVTDDIGVADCSVDSVLIDAPCSGLGTLRRHPDRRWRARPDEVTTLAALGIQMLERGSRLVRPGGFVVYSTCTVAREENGEVITAFLASEAGSAFVVDSLAGDVPREWEGFITAEGWFQSLPAEGGPDGHFVARLVRR